MMRKKREKLQSRREKLSRNHTLLFEIMKLLGAGDVVQCEFIPQDVLMLASVKDMKKSVCS